MKVKSLALAVGALAVVTAAVWFFNRDNSSGPAPDLRVGQPLLDTATVAGAAQFFLRSGGNEVTLTGLDATALKAGVVKEYHDLPADWSKFQRLVEDLTKADARITRMVGSTAQRLEKLGFSGDRIELRDKDGNPLWTLQLGNGPQSGGKFVRFGDEPKAYLSGLSTWFDTTPKNWADAALVNAKPDEVVGVQAQFPGGGTVSATRVDGKGVWKAPELAEGESLKESELNSLITRLTGLRFTDTREPEGLEAIAARPTARTYTLTLADGRTLTVTTSQRTDPQPAPETPPAEGETPPAPPPQPADVYVQSSRAEDPINDRMKLRSFQVADWTFSSLPATREALVNPIPAPAAPEETSTAPAPEDAPAESAAEAVSAEPADSAAEPTASTAADQPADQPSSVESAPSERE